MGRVMNPADQAAWTPEHLIHARNAYKHLPQPLCDNLYLFGDQQEGQYFCTCL